MMFKPVYIMLLVPFSFFGQHNSIDTLDLKNARLVQSCYFNDSTWYDEHTSRLLDSVAALCLGNKTISLRVTCYWDVRGKAPDNQLFSKARAETIRNALIIRNIDSLRITAIGMGEESPAARINPETGETETLTDEFIRQFKKDKQQFEYLHSLNRRLYVEIIKP